MQINQIKYTQVAAENNLDNTFEKMLDNAPIGMYLIQDGTFCYCNIKFARILGYEKDEIIYRKGIKELTFSADWPRVEENFIKFLTSDLESEHESLRIIRKDKSIIAVNIYGSKITYNGGLAVFGTLIDVTEEKNSSTQLNILAHAINCSGECVTITDLDHRIFYVNETLCRTFGYTSEELIGKYVGFFHEGCLEPSEFQKIIKATYEAGWNGEILSRRKDGTIFPILLSTTLVRDKNDNPLALVGFSQDISKRIKISEELGKSEREIKTLIDKMPDGLVHLKMICDKNGQPVDFEVVQVNHSFKKLMGISNEDLVGTTVHSQLRYMQDVNFNVIERFGEVCTKGNEEKFEVYSKMADRHYSISTYSPERNHVVAIVKDITLKRKAEEEIVKSRHMLRTILDNIPQRVFWKDINSKFLGCNIHFAKDIGIDDPVKIVGKSEYDINSRELAENYIKADKSIIETDTPINSECEQYLKTDNGKIWVRLNKMPLKNEYNNTIGVVGTYEDISKQRIAEENIRKLSQAVEQSPASIVITDLDGNIEYVNSKFIRLTGYTLEEVKGKNPRILKSGDMSSQTYKEMWQTISSGNNWEGEFHNKKKNGELYWERASISPIKDDEGVITHYLAVKEDITERKRSEEILRESERLLRETQAIARLGSYVLDIPKGIWQSSTILDSIFGIDEKFNHSVEGWISLIHPEWREAMADYFSNHVLKQHARFDKEYKIVRKSDGEERWVYGLGEVEYDSKNQPIKMIGTISDITERKCAEEALKNSFSLLEGTLESTVDGILVVDQNGKIQKFNNKFLNLWRIPESVIQTKNDDDALNFVLSQLKYPDQFLNKVKELYKDTTAESIDLLEFKDGRVFERYSRPQLIGNKAVGRVWSFRDITDRKIAEESLRESEAKFRTLFETSIEGILVADINEKNSLVNHRMAEMTGYTISELMNMSFQQLIPSDELENHFLKVARRKKGDSEIYERKLLRKDGTIIWTLVSASPIFNKAGKYTGSFGVFTDITERKKMLKELIVAKEKAEEANRVKSIFLANISHELRTPLVGILGYAETLFNEIENPEFKEMALILLKSGTRLKESLNLILDLSHIVADKLDKNISRQNLTMIVREKFRQLHSTAKEKGLKFQLVLGEEDLVINADERMLSQVIEHLLSNAIKYTNKGNVIVSISKIFENQTQFAQMKVKDTGIGIPTQSSRLIFEPFRQASEGLSRSFEGLGIGLTVAKKFIEMMGGEISVESEIGKGSEFTVKFPIYSDIDTGLLTVSAPEEISGKRIVDHYKFSSEVLLIEDDEPTANIVRFYLSETCKTDWACNAKNAISMAEKKNYSAILVDINLGFGMNGIEAINEIKKIKGYDSIPFIAVTAYALYGDREKFLSQGCSHYISKPFSKENIVELLEKVLPAVEVNSQTQL